MIRQRMSIMKKRVISFSVAIGLLVFAMIYSAMTGSIDVSVSELIYGLWTGTNEDVQVIKDLRLPRIIIAIFAGAMLSVSGTLLQAVVKNPLADRSEEHTSELQSRGHLVCRLLLEKKKSTQTPENVTTRKT